MLQFKKIKFLTRKQDLRLDKGYAFLYLYNTSNDFLNIKNLFNLENIGLKFNKIKIYAADIDYFKLYKMLYNIETVPTIILFYKRKEKKRLTKTLLREDFEKFFNLEKYDVK